MPGSSLLTDHFIEASAGTGKTYTIEQIVKRMICEEGLTLKEILIVTFTNAATFELKERIRKLLAKEGLLDFGEEAIYTIHAFCQKALKDFTFEANFPLETVDPAPDLLKQIARDALKGDLASFHPKQIDKLMALHRQDSEALVARLARLIACRVPIEGGPTYQESNEQIQAILAPLDRALFLQDLLALAPCYSKFCDRKKELKPEMKSGLTRLAEGHWIESPLLFFTPDNRLKRATETSLHYPGVLERLMPFAARALDPLYLLASLAEKIRLKAERAIEENEWIFFEDLIQKMRQNLTNASFVKALRNHYKAVIIDEFQDTDPDQWEIFSTLFLHHLPLYLVGDPKQAIYRFRRADIYTYLEAKKQISSLETLDTNYRSTPALVEGLNDLFADLSFPLPRTGEELLYQPVKAGKTEESLMPPIVLLRAQDEAELFHKVIAALQAHPELTAAVLVKDRYQAERFKAVCPLPVRLRRARCLLDSPAAQFMEELLTAIVSPHHSSALQLLLEGRLKQIAPASFWQWHHLLQEEGILTCIVQVLQEIGPTLMQQPQGELLYHDLLHIAEILEERDEGDPLEALDKLVQEDAESESLKGRQLFEEQAVEVMTIHVSKGLEFDLVCPIGLALAPTSSRDLVYFEGKLTPAEECLQAHEKEIEAERVRQIYVACTRPKKRLYLPLIEGEFSPIRSLVEGKRFPELYEQSVSPPKKEETLSPPLSLTWKGASQPIVSFSSLVQTHMDKKQQVLAFPAGAEVGVILHRILENINFTRPVTPQIITPFIAHTLLAPFTKEITQVIERVRTTSLPDGFTLAEVDPTKILRELPFIYPFEEGYCKGFIDLVFEHKNKIYIIDWKSNVIEGSIEEESERHQYPLQAQLYREAISRFLKTIDSDFEVAVFYFFLRMEKEAILAF